MSVLAINAGDRFIVRVIKFLATNPANKWANSYEFLTFDDASTSSLEGLVESCCEFEAAFHKDAVHFDRAIVSTWEADSKPYDPAAFLVIPQSLAGAVGPVGDNLPLDKCLSVARVARSGRVGHLFYRGVLNEADTAAPAGKSILTDRPGQQGIIDAALTSSGLADYVGVGAEGALRMVMINKTGTQTRPVADLTVQGVATLPTDHAWFNRTKPTSGPPL
jgi:hypothetical protein